MDVGQCSGSSSGTLELRLSSVLGSRSIETSVVRHSYCRFIGGIRSLEVYRFEDWTRAPCSG
jgi:hypothetical protein